MFRSRMRGRWLQMLGFHKDAIVRWRTAGLSTTSLLCVGLALVNNFSQPASNHLYKQSQGTTRRLLTSNETETSHGASWETCDYEKAHIPGAWIFFHTFSILTLFIALAVICDDFFVPSLEAISEKLNLSEDVAGATFMAAGSSAPELFTSIVGVAVETDVGVGTIVGSAIFNLLIIIAMTAALAGKVLDLDWRPLLRDSVCYAASVCCFIAFTWDGWLVHYEAALLVVLYIMYIVVMYYNRSIIAWMGTWKLRCSPSIEPNESNEENNTTDNAEVENGKLPKENNNAENKEAETATTSQEDEDEGRIQLCPCCPCCPAVRKAKPSKNDVLEKGGCGPWTKYIVSWIIFILVFPFVVLFSWTIPECSKPHNRKWFMVSFLVSVVWLAILTFTMVTLVSRTGCILRIDGYVMGLVVVAIGTSVPDLLSSILVAREGFGDMAVSNAIGSNVFDIDVGLGLPFIIRIAIDAGRPINLLSVKQWEDYNNLVMVIMPHAKFGLILLLVLVIALLVFGMVRFRLNMAIGVIFTLMYVIFLVYAFVQELYCVQVLSIYC